jgi:hypothetical protein
MKENNKAITALQNQPTQRPQGSDREVHEVWLTHQVFDIARISVLQSAFTRAAKVHHQSLVTVYVPSISYSYSVA